MNLPHLPRASSVLGAILAPTILALGLSAPFARSVHAEEALPDHASPSVCVVLIGLALQAGVIDEEDEADYRSASDNYRTISARLNGGKEGADQMIGSTVNFYSGLSEDQLSEGADMCLEARDNRFTEDE